MNRETCMICEGCGSIRLPVRKPISMVPTEGYTRAADCVAVRTYPCPECGTGSVDDNVQVLTAHTAGSSDYLCIAEAREHVHGGLASALADQLLKNQMIAFTVDGEGYLPGYVLVRGTLGVVRPKLVQSINARALDLAQQMLAGSADRAAEEIRQWGMFISGDSGNISKAQAVSAIRTAFAKQRQDAEQRFGPAKEGSDHG